MSEEKLNPINVTGAPLVGGSYLMYKDRPIAICPFISRKRGVRTAEAPFLFRTYGSLRIITARVISGVPYFASACSSQMIPYPNASYSPFLPPCRYTLF